MGSVNYAANIEMVVVEMVLEAQSRTSRLVGFGFPENGSDLDDVRTYAKGLQLDPHLIIDCYRLGESQPNQHYPRLMKICFVSSVAASQFVKLPKPTQFKSDHQYARVWFRNDMSKEERETDKKLREQLVEKRKMNPNLVIRNGQIVDKSKKSGIRGGGRAFNRSSSQSSK